MANVKTTNEGAYDPEDLKEWMIGRISRKNHNEITILNPDNYSNWRGIYAGDFHFSKRGEIGGTVNSFTYYLNDPSRTYITFDDLHANATRVFRLIEDGDITPLLRYLLQGNDTIDAVKTQSYYGNSKIDGWAGDDVLLGGSRRDFLAGGKGDDKLLGNGGADSLDGESGSDSLDGGAGADTFHFSAGSGRDKIVNFEVARDTIHIDVIGIETFEDLTIKTHAKNAIIKIDREDSITLLGVNASSLSSDDFDFGI